MAKFWPPCCSGRLCAPAPMDMRAARPPGLNFVFVAVSKDTSPEAPLPLYAAPKYGASSYS